MHSAFRPKASLALLSFMLLAASSTFANASLRDELLEMGRRDQEVRERMLALMPTIDLRAPTPEWIAIATR